MGWNGDISRMGRLADNLGRLSRVPSQAAPLAAERILDIINDEFERGEDPYGNQWADLAPATIAKGRYWPPLTDTRTMRGTVASQPLPGAGFAITIDHPAQVHQTGGYNAQTGWRMPARPVLPGGAFPSTWIDAIDGAVAETVGGMVGGGRL